MKVLLLSLCFPNPDQPGQGAFVVEQARRLTKLANTIYYLLFLAIRLCAVNTIWNERGVSNSLKKVILRMHDLNGLNR